MKTKLTIALLCIIAILSCTNKTVTNESLAGIWQRMDNDAEGSKREVGVSITGVSTVTFESNGRYTRNTIVYFGGSKQELFEDGTYELGKETITFHELNHNNYTSTHKIEQPSSQTLIICTTGGEPQTYKRLK